MHPECVQQASLIKGRVDIDTIKEQDYVESWLRLVAVDPGPHDGHSLSVTGHSLQGAPEAVPFY